MTINEIYKPSSLLPSISWPHFLHVWGFKAKDMGTEAAKSLCAEAKETLLELELRGLIVKARARVMEAVSKGDDIILNADGGEVCLPCLRQQVMEKDSDVCRCLSDYVAPEALEHPIGNKVGVFATSVDVSDFMVDAGEYRQMLYQTLADRLAEAAAETLHASAHRKVWAVGDNAPCLGIRPAVGYPCLPDMSLNFILDRILDFSAIGVRLTSSAMMHPHASVSGLIFAHPEAKYFSVGKITDEQLLDYASRRGMPIEEVRKFVVC